MIEMQRIMKYYSTDFIKTFALRNIDLDVREGEFLTIMGPSSAGNLSSIRITENFVSLNKVFLLLLIFLNGSLPYYVGKERNEIRKRPRSRSGF